jgi:predicted site-specific integrase-resolvase
MAKRKAKSKLLTVREVAERLDVATSTVRIWRIAGRFPNAQAEETPRGRVWYIPESDLEGFEKRGPGRPAKKKARGK